MAREDMTKLLSGAAGLLSVLAILLLLYVAVCNVFFNHDGHTEKILGKKDTKKSGRMSPVIMPIATGGVMMIINIIISNTMHSGKYITAAGGVLCLLAGDAALTSVKCICLCIVSVALLTAGSVIFDKIGGSKYSALFCLNIALSLMTLPYIYSIVALIWAVGYWALKHKEYLLLAVAVIVGIAVHFPMAGFSMGEAFMLVYLILIPLMAKLDKGYFKWLTVILTIACGFFAVFSQLIYGFM